MWVNEMTQKCLLSKNIYEEVKFLDKKYDMKDNSQV